MMEQLESFLNLMAQNHKVSALTQSRDLGVRIQDVQDETQELREEFERISQEGGNPFEDLKFLDELGDAIGAMSLLLTFLPEEVVSHAMDLNIAKYRRRKPWIFSDWMSHRKVELPGTSEKEDQKWQEAKKLEREEPLILKVNDWTSAPGGRYRKHGPFSGEEYRDDFLIPALLSGRRLIIDLDGTFGFPTSWLWEVFGNLSYVYKEMFPGHVEIKSEECPSFKTQIEECLRPEVQEGWILHFQRKRKK